MNKIVTNAFIIFIIMMSCVKGEDKSLLPYEKLDGNKTIYRKYCDNKLVKNSIKKGIYFFGYRFEFSNELKLISMLNIANGAVVSNFKVENKENSFAHVFIENSPDESVNYPDMLSYIKNLSSSKDNDINYAPMLFKEGSNFIFSNKELKQNDLIYIESAHSLSGYVSKIYGPINSNNKLTGFFTIIFDGKLNCNFAFKKE